MGMSANRVDKASLRCRMANIGSSRSSGNPNIATALSPARYTIAIYCRSSSIANCQGRGRVPNGAQGGRSGGEDRCGGGESLLSDLRRLEPLPVVQVARGRTAVALEGVRKHLERSDPNIACRRPSSRPLRRSCEEDARSEGDPALVPRARHAARLVAGHRMAPAMLLLVQLSAVSLAVLASMVETDDAAHRESCEGSREWVRHKRDPSQPRPP